MLKSNRLRGAQKLKFYCQLCRKQCKDEHGWKCHLNSFSHQGRMREFAANPESSIEKYSQQFEDNFIEMMRDRYPNVRKKANELYVEFIDDKNHVHMNATRWPTLTAFCEHLKTLKNIAVEEREQIYLTYLEVDANDFKKQVDSSKLQKDKTKETTLEWKALQEQILKAKQAETRVHKESKPSLSAAEEFETLEPGKMSFSLQIDNSGTANKRLAVFSTEALEEDVANDEGPIKYKKKCTNTEKLLQMIRPREAHPWEVSKQKESEPEKQEAEPEAAEKSWVAPGIIVKILPHEIDERFHNRKAEVVYVPEEFVARLQCNGTTLEIDQTYLETVIPKEGSPVVILVGEHAGQRAIMDRVYPDEGYAVLVFLRNGKEVSLSIPCSDFSKAAS